MDEKHWMRQICADIYDITGIKAVFYDAKMQMIYAHPKAMGEFCKEIRTKKEMELKCIACDRNAFDKACKSGEICIYRCHMGLTEVVAPIMDRGELLGYLLFGQLLSENGAEYISSQIAACPLERKDYMNKLLSEMVITNESTIRAAARLMAMCTSYVQLQRALRAKEEGLGAALVNYINEHLAEPLSVGVLCKALRTSRSTLYNVSKQTLGMGVSDYIRSRRISAAITLLKESASPIYKIAETVGIDDANYLTKLIKKTTGKTPRQIKKEL